MSYAIVLTDAQSKVFLTLQAIYSPVVAQGYPPRFGDDMSHHTSYYYLRSEFNDWCHQNLGYTPSVAYHHERTPDNKAWLRFNAKSDYILFKVAFGEYL